jgi:hypothetical protein
MAPNEPDQILSPSELLQSEFEYIAQTAFQAHEDRARVTTFYLVNLGGFVAALYSSQMSNAAQSEVYILFCGLFMILSATGLLTIVQLIRLRQAWFESIMAMNQIKEFYRVRFPALKLETAFRWHKGNLPALYKPWSISYMLTLQIALLSGISLGAAVFYLGLMFQYSLWLGAILVGVGYVVAQMVLYRWLLIGKGKRKRKSLEDL